MQLAEAEEAELADLVGRLDRLVPREGAHLTIPGDPDGHTTVGNRLGYLRLGIELLAAGLRPLSRTDAAPDRIEPDIEYLLSEGSRTPFDLCELDEAIVSRPPVQTRLGPLGQLAAGVLAVAVLVVLVIGAFVVLRRLLG